MIKSKAASRVYDAFFDGRPLMCHVLFNSLLYFYRYALDKLSIAKIKNESKFVNTGDRVMALAFCNFLYSPLSLYQVSFI